MSTRNKAFDNLTPVDIVNSNVDVPARTQCRSECDAGERCTGCCTWGEAAGPQNVQAASSLSVDPIVVASEPFFIAHDNLEQTADPMNAAIQEINKQEIRHINTVMAEILAPTKLFRQEQTAAEIILSLRSSIERLSVPVVEVEVETRAVSPVDVIGFDVHGNPQYADDL